MGAVACGISWQRFFDSSLFTAHSSESRARHLAPFFFGPPRAVLTFAVILGSSRSTIVEITNHVTVYKDPRFCTMPRVSVSHSRCRPCFQLALAIFSAVASSGFGAPFTPGNIVVQRIFSSVALTTTAAASTLDEYTTGGSFVQSIPLPTVAAGANYACTQSGSATSEVRLHVQL